MIFCHGFYYLLLMIFAILHVNVMNLHLYHFVLWLGHSFQIILFASNFIHLLFSSTRALLYLHYSLHPISQIVHSFHLTNHTVCHSIFHKMISILIISNIVMIPVWRYHMQLINTIHVQNYHHQALYKFYHFLFDHKQNKIHEHHQMHYLLMV